MAASTKHVLVNVERMAGDDELLRLWNAQAQAKNADGAERTIQQAWLAFIQAADEAKIADRIPGTVGRTFKAQYATDSQSGAGLKAKQTRTATSRPAPAVGGAKAGGSGRSRSKAAQAGDVKP